MAEKHQTLRQYQEYLLQRMQAARGEGGAEKIVMLGFLSGGRHYLIDGRDVEDVHQLSTLEPIPVAKPWAVGAANIKGTVHAITDFSILMGGERTKRGKFMVLTQDIMAGSAINIEAISGLYDLNEIGELSPGREAAMPDWISGHYPIGGNRYFLVDALKLAVDVRFSKLQSGESQ